MNIDILRSARLITITLMLSALSAGCSPEPRTIASIKNLKQPSEQILVGGQPNSHQLTALAEAGVKHVINLRPRAELPNFDEAQLAAAEGMEYHLLPIHGAKGLTLENVRALDRLLLQAGEDKVFLHCASGNRVGAMMALRSALIYGEEAETALAVGKTWGVTSLEPEVRKLLGMPPS